MTSGLRKIIKTICIIGFLGIVLVKIYAYAAISIPMDSWIYKSVSILQTAGYMRDLDQGCQPYTRSQIAGDLYIMAKTVELNAVQIRREYDRLTEEFRNELKTLNSSEKPGANESLYFHSDLSDFFSSQNRNYLYLRLTGSVNLLRNFTLHYGAYLDQRFADDPFFSGYEWLGFQGYQEQIYIAYQNNGLRFKFGRDYVKWGYGKTGRLWISDNSRAFDILSLNLKSKHLSCQAFLAQLDPVESNQRYLTAIRFEIDPCRNFYFGFGQSTLYGGKNRVPDWAYTNPLSVFYFVEENEMNPANIMIYFDLAWYFLKQWKFYGELLVDDFMIEKKVKSDLEPNQVGYLVGVEGVNLWSFFNGWIEFVQVRNRTYNVQTGSFTSSFEKFLHNNMPIGHPMGTDFQLLSTEWERWLGSHFRVRLGYSLLRKGEGTIRGQFTEPWMADDITMQTGYKEKIPWGVVETSNTLSISIHYEFNSRIQADLGFQYMVSDNYQHVKGETESEFAIAGRLLIEYAKYLRF